jgi:hypothetical protein
MQLVIVESPFMHRDPDKGVRRLGTLRNVTYARLALHDCIRRGEAPYASHLLYTQPWVLDDDVPEERELGIKAGLLWGLKADRSVFYTDLGVSTGMVHGAEAARKAGRPAENRILDGWDDAASETPRRTLERLGLYTSADLDRIEAGFDSIFASELRELDFGPALRDLVRGGPA